MAASLEEFQGIQLSHWVVVSNTPPKTNMEPKNWWFVDVSPFPRGYFQVPAVCFQGCIFLFLILLGEMIQFDSYFSNGLKPSPSHSCASKVFRIAMERSDAFEELLDSSWYHGRFLTITGAPMNPKMVGFYRDKSSQLWAKNSGCYRISMLFLRKKDGG